MSAATPREVEYPEAIAEWRANGEAERDYRASVALWYADRCAALEEHVKRLRRLESAAHKLAASFPPDAYARAKKRAQQVNGSGGDHFITNARLRDFLAAASSSGGATDTAAFEEAGG